MPKRGFPTPDEPVGEVDFLYWLLRVPDIPEFTMVVRGALSWLGYLSVWEEVGSMSEYNASIFMKEMYNGIKMIDFFIGTITPLYISPIPDNYLVADGSTHARDDYPLLWEVTPPSMRTPTSLTLPDLRDRFIIASGNNHPPGTTGGEENHTLTSDEMPIHSHGYTQYTFGIDIESVGVPDPTGVGNPRLPEQTNQAGGGQAHNNMPPYYSMVYVVLAKL